MFMTGDRVIYRSRKCTTRPGRRAQHIHPAENGDYYDYFVEKYWLVARVSDSRLELVTRRGKKRVVDQDDPALRRATLWERWVYRRRFPKPTS